MIGSRLLIHLLFLLAISAWNCSPKVSDQVTNTDKASMEEKIEALAVKHFETGYQIDYNKSKSFVSLSKSFKTRKNEAFNSLALVVYDIKQEEVILQETFSRATAKWINDTEIEVVVIPGMMAEDKPAKPGFIFDVKNKKKNPR